MPTTLRVNTQADLEDVTLAVDKRGNALAFWDETLRRQGGGPFLTSNVLWSHFAVSADGTGGSWNAAQTLVADVPKTFGTPVVFAPDGNAFVLCSQLVAPLDYRVRLNHYTASSNSWDGFTPVGGENPIGSDHTEFANLLDLTIDPSGNLLADWTDTLFDGGTQVSGGPRYNHFAAGGGWSTASRLDSGIDRPPGAVFWHQGMLDANGDGAIVWAQWANDGTKNVWARAYE